MRRLYPDDRRAHLPFARRRRSVIGFITTIQLLIALCCVSSVASAAPDPSTTFTRNCSSCHTFGHGVLVGPDLKGATDRHDRKWLTAWISSSERLIQSGGATARAVLAEFKRERVAG